MQRKKVALGMSGGVDSSVAAHLLKEQGYDVTGVYLECWRAPGCRTEEDRKDALAVALELDIPFQVLDFKEAYRQRVVEYFFTEYAAGRTPNPDVMCNREIKFGLFYDWAMEQGFDAVATGHYAQILSATDKQPVLASAVDAHKDQTYFLYLLRPDQLDHVIFPIGHLTKPQVRQAARERHIRVAEKKDSVGICFIGDIDVTAFLKERLGEQPGDVVDMHGRVIGEHRGLWFYTVGQRHGFTIFPTIQTTDAAGHVVDKHNIPPFYVIRKNAAKNELVVGFGAETMAAQFRVAAPHLLFSPEHSAPTFVRIRHTGALLPCTIDRDGEGWMVKLVAPIQGIAEGQSAVVYTPMTDHDELICWGGGVICDVQ